MRSRPGPKSMTGLSGRQCGAHPRVVYWGGHLRRLAVSPARQIGGERSQARYGQTWRAFLVATMSHSCRVGWPSATRNRWKSRHASCNMVHMEGRRQANWRMLKRLNFLAKLVGWGTWIRTRTNGVRVRGSTVNLFPSSFGERQALPSDYLESGCVVAMSDE